MTAKELLSPRFEVIAPYPGNFWTKVGMVLENPYELGSDWYDEWVANLEQYPNIFRKVDWWEGRTKEQMPKKLKSISFPDDGPYIIQEWDMAKLFGQIKGENHGVGCILTGHAAGFGYIPID